MTEAQAIIWFHENYPDVHILTEVYKDGTYNYLLQSKSLGRVSKLYGTMNACWIEGQKDVEEGVYKKMPLPTIPISPIGQVGTATVVPTTGLVNDNYSVVKNLRPGASLHSWKTSAGRTVYRVFDNKSYTYITKNSYLESDAAWKGTAEELQKEDWTDQESCEDCDSLELPSIPKSSKFPDKDLIKQFAPDAKISQSPFGKDKTYGVVVGDPTVAKNKRFGPQDYDSPDNETLIWANALKSEEFGKYARKQILELAEKALDGLYSRIQKTHQNKPQNLLPQEPNSAPVLDIRNESRDW